MKQKGYSAFSTFFLLVFIGSALAGSSWPEYKKAATLFKTGGGTEEVRHLCHTILTEARDPVVRARAGFLLSDLFASSLEFRSAYQHLDPLLADEALPSGLRDEARLRKARLLRRQGKEAKAISFLRQVASQGANPFTIKEGRLGLAEVYSDQLNWQQADSVLERLQSPETEERAQVVVAKKLLAGDEVAAAIEILQKYKGEQALWLLAKAYSRAGKLVQDAHIYKRIQEEYPDRAAQAMFEAGEVFLAASDWTAAALQFRRVLETFPHSDFTNAATFRLGYALLNAGEAQQALAAFGRDDDAPQDLRFLYMQAECLRALVGKRPEAGGEAIALFRQVAALAADSQLGKSASLRAAQVMMQAGRTEDAVILLRQYLALHAKDPSKSMVSFVLAQRLPLQAANRYLNDILAAGGTGSLADATLAALQLQDFNEGRYIEVVNRAGRYFKAPEGVSPSYWRSLNHLLLAESAYFLEQYETADEHYRLALPAQEEIAQKAALGRAWVALQQGRLLQAISDFEELRKAESAEHRERAIFGLATAQFRAGEYEQAIGSYTSFVSEMTGPAGDMQARALGRLADSYIRLGYQQDAIDTWRRIVEVAGVSDFAAVAQFEIAETYFRTHHFAEAKQGFEAFLKNFGAHAHAATSWLRMAQCDFNAGHLDSAISGFQQFLENYPFHEYANDALEGVQHAYFQLGRQEEAASVLQELIGRYPEALVSAEGRLLLGENLVADGEFDAARKSFKEVVTLYPGSSYAVEAQFALAQSYYASEDYAVAIADLSQFLTYFPESEQADDAIFALAVSYFNTENYRGAKDQFLKILNEYPESQFFAPSLQNMGWCLVRLQETDRALETFRRYLAQEPDSDDSDKVRLEMARLLALAGQHHESTEILLKARQSEVGDIATEAEYRLGISYLEMQREKDARRSFQRAIELGRQDGYYRLSAISQMAALHEIDRDWDQALAMYQLLLQAASEEAWTTAALERIDAISAIADEVSE